MSRLTLFFAMSRQMPPPFDPHNMPPPPGRGGPPPPVHGPMMGESPFYDHMSAPPKGYFDHPFRPNAPHGHMGAHDYRGTGGTRGEGRSTYFNNVSDYHLPPFDMNFSKDPANCQSTSSDGMASGGNYPLPPDNRIYPDTPQHQSVACRYMCVHANG